MPMFAQTTGSLHTNSATPTAIPGLTFVLPEGNGPVAIIILNIPNPYAQGNNYPGGNFWIAVNGTVQAPYASFTYGVQVPPSTNRMPTTLVVGVPLTMKPQTIQAMWGGIRGSTVLLDSPATLTGLLD